MRITTVIALAAVLWTVSCSSISGQSYDDPRVYKKETAAFMAEYRGNYKKAIKVYDKLIEEKPGNVSYRQKKAECYKKLKQYDLAIREYRYLIDNFPPDHQNYIQIHNLEYLRGDIKAAWDAINQGIGMLDDPRLYEFRGKDYLRAGNREKAAEDFAMAYSKARSQNLDVTHYAFYADLAIELRDVMDYETALQAIDYAYEKLEDAPTDEILTQDLKSTILSNYLIYKSSILGLSGQYTEALEQLNTSGRSAGSKSSQAAAMVQRGILLMMLGNYADALPNFRRSRSVTTVHMGQTYYEWECYYRMEDQAGCLRSADQWDREAGGNSSFPSAYRCLTQIRFNPDPETLRQVDQLIASHPDKAELYFIKSRCLALLDQKAAAVESFKQALDKGFLDPYKFRFGMPDLHPVFTSEEDRALLADLNIDLPAGTGAFSERQGLIHCKPYRGNEQRLAIIIGNGRYEHGGMLANPENDANDMAAVLDHLGFEVMKYENADQNTMKRAIDKFGYRLKLYDVGLFFYAGHGIQVDGVNYLIPVDAEIRDETDVEFSCVDAGRVLARMEDAGNRINIIILDACRDNPFERSWTRSSRGRGLARMDAPTGSIIAYATEPGNTASDGPGRNGLYTEVLLNEMQEPGLIIEKMFRQVRTRVIDRSGGKQTPWESTSLTGDFLFLDE